MGLQKMNQFWILKVKDDSNSKYSLTGLKIFNHRMSEKVWGIRGFTEKGRKTANVSRLEEDDRVLFYYCGSGGYCFLGSAILERGFDKLRESVFHEQYLDWKEGVTFKSVDPWATSLPIEALRGKVRFVPNDENYGSYLQGSITKISKEDYETVIHEHMIFH
ncbi:MAG TPA: hypothetical protein VLV84_01490 [Candidatus Acidoferrales bacterium]|nr:hypothetical protein [Candidatus Acidoferrales bacterium]